ncbi:MAG: hypothetical protein BGO68_00665 [Candidatus Amoebophilus sp. 36-38]|nr:MAG: hypothetical protein BGO68_00665 [Candidatus Amoebophilus sp. 36-38]
MHKLLIQFTYQLGIYLLLSILLLQCNSERDTHNPKREPEIIQHESEVTKKIDLQPTEVTKAVCRTVSTGFLVPIVCGLPELMVVKKQLELRTQGGLLLARQTTTPSAFLSGVALGWVSGGLKAISYANKELICNGIARMRGNNKDDNPSQFDRVLASLVVGAIDAVTTHAPSSMRALQWTNPHASVTLNKLPFLSGLKKLYRIGFTTRIIKASINAGCYVAFTPWLEKDIKPLFPSNLSKLLAILGSGVFAGFVCTSMDVIGAHIYKEAFLAKNEVRAPSFLKMSRGLYHQNGLKIFFSGASWNALVSALAFGTMASVEYFVNSKPFAEIYQETYRFFKRVPNNGA